MLLKKPQLLLSVIIIVNILVNTSQIVGNMSWSVVIIVCLGLALFSLVYEFLTILKGELNNFYVQIIIISALLFTQTITNFQCALFQLILFVEYTKILISIHKKNTLYEILSIIATIVEFYAQSNYGLDIKSIIGSSLLGLLIYFLLFFPLQNEKKLILNDMENQELVRDGTRLKESITITKRRESLASGLSWFQAFDVLPQGILIIDSCYNEQFLIAYKNTACTSILDTENNQEIMQILVNLKSKHEKVEQLKQNSLSIPSYKSISQRKNSSHKFFKYMNSFKSDNYQGSSSQEKQERSNNYFKTRQRSQYFFKSSINPKSDEQIVRSPSNTGQVQFFSVKQDFDKDIFSNIMQDMWVEVTEISKKQRGFIQQLTYVHESEIFVTQFEKKNGVTQYMDIKIFSAIQENKPTLLVILRDVSHRDYIDLLKKSNIQKQKTLSFVSHEFRVPLNCVINMLDAVKDHVEQEDKTLIQSSIDNCKQLLNLSNDLLDLAQLKSGKFKIKLCRFNLKNTLQESINMFLIQAKKKEIKLELQYGKDLPQFIISDKDRIKQVTTNLIGNAIKFTRENGNITIKVTEDDIEYLMIEVIDDGIGVRDEDKPKLFSAFGKIENKETDTLNPQGVGLGLIISNQIAHQLSDNQSGLGFKSTYGEGTVFCFKIKNMSCDTETDQIENVQESERHLDLQKKLDNIKGFVKQSFVPKSQAPILIVDDNQFNIEMLQFLFQRHYKGMVKTEYAIQGFQAEENVKARFITGQPYRLIFMDIEMPFQSGVVTARNIRDLYRQHKQPIFIVGCSGYSSEKDRLQFTTEMDDYVIKPVTQDKLEQIMRLFYFD